MTAIAQLTTTQQSDIAEFWRQVCGRLGLKNTVTTEFDFFQAIHQGIGLRAIDTLKKEGLLASEIALIIEPRTLSHRRTKRQPLSPEESERAARVSRMLTLATRVFGSRDKALAWLRKPQSRIGGLAPMALLSGESGGRIVEEALIQIDEGYFA
ncbi:MAG: antitoxin Xre/MbcA/ParS toxin-binding domain-containing protein [Burkholderiales bacterium]